MPNKAKTVINFFILIIFALIIGWYFWYHVRPKIIYAGCTDVAATTINFEQRFNLNYEQITEFENIREECITSPVKPR